MYVLATEKRNFHMHRKNESDIRLSNYKPSAYLIDKTEFNFDLDEKDTVVTSTLNIRKNPDVKDSVNTLILDGEKIKPTSVAINGEELDPTQYKVTKSTLTINNVPKTFKLQIQNHLYPKANKTLDGLYATNGVLCTLCEAENMRRLTYFIDRPDVLSSYKTTLMADQKKYPILLSNGMVTSKGKSKKNGKHWVTWSDPIVKPSYLFVLVAGKFDIAEDTYTTKSGRDIKIQVYVEKGKADHCGLAIDMVKKAMRWDEETYGREYDLNTYKIVTVDDFGASADENTGINIFKTDCLLASPSDTEEHALSWIQSTVPHEFFHHWSGNRVTIRDWFQVSLKEGLTTFREQSFNEDTFTPAERLNSVKSLKSYQFPADGYPVQPQSFKRFEYFQQNATASIYNKGAEIFRMLETVLGKALFRKAMSLYFDRYKGKAATFENYISTLEEVSGKNLSQFLLWFRQPGTPELKVTDEYDAKSKTYTLRFDQSSLSCSEGVADLLNITPKKLSNTKPMPIPIRLALFDKYGKSISLNMTGSRPEKEKVLLLTENKAEFTFKNVHSKPIPSLLRGYSAPVILSFERKLDDLRLLLTHDQDIYSRTSAGKKYIEQTLLNMVREYSENQHCSTPDTFIETMRILLKSKSLDPLVLSKLLALPSETSISLSMEQVDLDAIHQARETLLIEMAGQLKEEFESALTRNATHDEKDLASDPGLRKTLGKRQLQNACRYYLIRVDGSDMLDKLVERFEETLSTNLSDNLAALQLLVDQGGEEADSALDTFYEKWKDNPEKVQRWIEIQALSQSPNYFTMMRKLLDHEAFDITHERQASVLFYGFFANLPKCYSASEESYQFIAELHDRLTEVKSTLADQLIIIVATWVKLFDQERLAHLQKHLGHILKDNIEEVEEPSEDSLEVMAAVNDDNEEYEEEAEEEAEEEIKEEVEEEEKLNEEPDELEQIEEATEEEEEEELKEEEEEAEEAEEEESKEALEEAEVKPHARAQALLDKSLNKDDLNLGSKTNRQIHILLQKQGLFNNKPELLNQSLDKSCDKDRDGYRQFAEKLLKK